MVRYQNYVASAHTLEDNTIFDKSCLTLIKNILDKKI